MFIDESRCRDCHEPEYERWRGSHHDLAMQPATAETVLGDFDDATFSYFGVTSRLFKRGGKFFVRTDGPDGRLADFEILYTFGVTPLQQYLVALDGGRLQALPIAWDTAGRRWFHLYPDEPIRAGDQLHWTGIYQNWNMMCAECHSTGVRKNYDPATGRYQTTWFQIDVGCQACHGPGSLHVAWAEARERGRSAEQAQRQGAAGDSANGLLLHLARTAPGAWRLDPATLKYYRSAPRASDVEIETCARCHARRRTIDEQPPAGRPLLDTHVPELIGEPLYFADGQIREEVYVYGSFLQSKMYRRGVRCSDCHDPHSLRLAYPADNVCASCHLDNVYAGASHHFHKAGSAGASCIACHMPPRTYMQVDVRRDHSFRIPRPDLSVEFGTPNACTSCHEDKTPEWAAAAARTWWGNPAGRPPTTAALLARASRGDAQAARALAGDETLSGLVRASALAMLAVAGGSPAAGSAEFT
ncbi:MAG: hypothetical protein D6760_06255, partial [Deltaproteobacteria bacterium]